MPSLLKRKLRVATPLLVLILLFSVVQAGAIPRDQLTKKRYNLARARNNALLFSPQLASQRKNWQQTINAFKQAYRTDPYHTLAPYSLLSMGHLNFKLYKRFSKLSDLHEALGFYDDVVSLFPQHSFADDALYKSAQIHAFELKDYKSASLVFARLLAVYPGGDMVRKAAADLRKLKKTTPKQSTQPVSPPRKKTFTAAKPIQQNNIGIGNKSQIKKIRHWATKSYTRVVIETSKPVKYSGHLLRKEGNKPRRLYVNIDNCRIPKKLQHAIPIDNGLLKQVRSAQFNTTTARVVLDTVTLSEYKIFNLEDPFRIVIDVKGKEQKTIATPTKIVNIPNAPSLAQQLGLGIKRVILDPGHGGKDPGAVGSGGLLEKDIVLKVAKKLARKLTKELGCQVILTRKRDVFLPLEERTAIANTKEGDLFISIHVNAAKSKKARGIETYYLDLAMNKADMRVAARENATSAKKISDLQNILSSLMHNSKKDESAKLASIVQKNLVKGLNSRYKDIKNHGVKKAPFIVLIGAQMPSVLAEIAFITNTTEAKRLRSDAYLESIADHLANGIAKYAMTLNMASL